MFGVTHVRAIDGFSKKSVGHSTMPIKNNLTIYEEVYKNAVLSHGMWDQVRVDHGREFDLSLFMQDILAEYRHNQQRLPYLQITSTKVTFYYSLLSQMADFYHIYTVLYSGRERSTCCNSRKHIQIKKRAANSTDHNGNVSRGPKKVSDLAWICLLCRG